MAEKNGLQFSEYTAVAAACMQVVGMRGEMGDLRQGDNTVQGRKSKRRQFWKGQSVIMRRWEWIKNWKCTYIKIQNKQSPKF